MQQHNTLYLASSYPAHGHSLKPEKGVHAWVFLWDSYSAGHTRGNPRARARASLRAGCDELMPEWLTFDAVDVVDVPQQKAVTAYKCHEESIYLNLNNSHENPAPLIFQLGAFIDTLTCLLQLSQNSKPNFHNFKS